MKTIDITKINLAKDLKLFLKSNKMSQKEFAKLSGISQSIISKVLRGHDVRYRTFLKFWPYLYGNQKK
jgi:predicted transcriptional regulator